MASKTEPRVEDVEDDEPEFVRGLAAGTSLVNSASIDDLMVQAVAAIQGAATYETFHIRNWILAVRGHTWELQAAVRHLRKLMRAYERNLAARNNGGSK